MTQRRRDGPASRITVSAISSRVGVDIPGVATSHRDQCCPTVAPAAAIADRLRRRCERETFFFVLRNTAQLSPGAPRIPLMHLLHVSDGVDGHDVPGT